MKIIISADSTCDLSPELIRENDIHIVPLYVSFGDESFKDGIDITPHEMLKKMDETGTLPKTSAIPIGVYIEEFKKLRAEADAVIYFSISSGFSSSCQNAALAAESVEGVYVVDTKNLSTGEALLVLKACNLAKEGKSPEEIVSTVEGLVDKVDASFVINSLENLYKGGRCSALTHLGANLLQIKPCIEVKDGKMDVGKKYRGKYRAVTEKYASDRLKEAEADDEFVFVTYSEMSPEFADVPDVVENVVKNAGMFKKIYRTEAGCTVSTHCGRNTIGVLFIRK